MSSELRVDKIIPTGGVPTDSSGGVIQFKGGANKQLITDTMLQALLFGHGMYCSNHTKICYK